MNRYVVSTFPIDEYRKIPMQKRFRGNPGTQNKKQYRDVLITFDIETSLVPFTQHSIMYIWQMQIGDIGTVFGRTWDEFKTFCGMLIADLQENQYICVYVHNLSFEHTFLAGIYDFTPKEVFAVKARKVLKCEMYNAIEFRCSYLLTNMSLAEFTKRMKVEHVKRPGEDIDYTVYRTPDTELTEKQLIYCQNDVLGLKEAIEIKMRNDHDNLYTIPMTSTGYVRRDTKAALRYVNHNYIKNQLVDYDIHILFREAFRGGNTHANRFFSGQILHDVKSFDRASSYPDVQCNELFPIAEFKQSKTDYKSVMKLLEKNRPIICRVYLTNVRLRDRFWPMPYLTKDKCRNTINGLFDNGRILECEYTETTVTDIDLKIIMDEYEIDNENIKFSDVYYSRYGKLPPAYIHNVIKYFRQKTELKGTGDEYNYMKNKNLLNSIYGMSATNPCKENILFDNGLYTLDTVPLQELYEKYKKKAFQPYQWGIWTTAHARYALEMGIRIAHYGNMTTTHDGKMHDCVYVDTDSVKYIGDCDFSEFNRIAKEKSEKSGACADDVKGKRHYMGMYEQEETYTRFKTLGAKKYCYEYSDSNLHTTIAGVSKKVGGAELMKAAKETGRDAMELFEDGFVFVEAGGNMTVYNDFPEQEEIELYINGKPFQITRNESIIPSTYRVGLTDEYAALLAACGVEDINQLWQQ